MDAIEKLLIENACRDLMTRYCLSLDNRDIDGFLDIFTEDGIWELTNSTTFALTGHAALRAFFEKRQTDFLNRHYMMNPHVTVLSATEATGFCAALIVDGPAGPTPVPLRGIELITEYRDTYRLTPVGWRITRRSMVKIIDAKLSRNAA